MKFSLSVLALAALFTTGFSQSATQVSFVFKGFDEAKHKGFVEVRIPHIVDPFSQQIRIDENGEFASTLNIKEESEILVSYDNHIIPLIVTPGDQVKINLNLDDYLKDSSDPKAKVTGNRAKVNFLIIAFGNEVKRWIDLSSAFYADKTLKPSDYKIQRISEMDRQLKLLDRLIHDKKIKEPGFADWARSKIRYATGKDLSLFPFIGKMSKDLHDQSEYFDFLSMINPNENQKVWYESYFSFLEILCTTYQIIANTSDEYKDQREILKKQKGTNFPITWSIISRLPEGPGKEYLFAKLFQTEEARIPPEYRDSLPRKVSQSLLDALMKTEGTETATITELIHSFQISEPEKRGLLDIYEAAKGKTVYHDFMIKGCAPCLSELPHYNAKIEKAGGDVVFLFIGAGMKQAELEKMLSKDQVKGLHYVITKNQLAFYERYFGLRGFPHHQIVNQEGMIVKGKAYGPGDSSVDQFLKQFK